MSQPPMEEKIVGESAVASGALGEEHSELSVK